MIKRVLMLGLILLMLPAYADRTEVLANAQKIYIESFGQEPESRRFHMLLGGCLETQEFNVTATPEDADIIIEGVVTTQNVGMVMGNATTGITGSQGTTYVATLLIRDREGKKVWGYEAGNGSARILAQKVVKEFQKEQRQCQKALKTQENHKRLAPGIPGNKLKSNAP